MGKPKETVWDAIARFTPQLDQLQHKGETITSEAPLDPEIVSAQYWNKVSTNLIDLAQKFESSHQVRANVCPSNRALHYFDIPSVYWIVVLILTPYMLVCAFLQLGKNAGKDSSSVAVDVATDWMEKKGITPKFTIDELRDMVSQSKCGVRGQSRTFHKLDRNLQWSGDTISIKVPVIHLQVFPEEVQLTLARSKYPDINDFDIHVTYSGPGATGCQMDSTIVP